MMTPTLLMELASQREHHFARLARGRTAERPTPPTPARRTENGSDVCPVHPLRAPVPDPAELGEARSA